MIWKLKPFNELSVNELYQCMQLRQAVFIVEQKCIFNDMDDMDQHCYHLMGFEGITLFAYARLVPPGVLYDEPGIGRIVTHSAIRKTGLGKMLVEQGIATCETLFGKQPIKIMAQSYLLRFYEAFGFVKNGNEFYEDDILHYYMIRP
jgi:ElaA protein